MNIDEKLMSNRPEALCCIRLLERYENSGPRLPGYFVIEHGASITHNAHNDSLGVVLGQPDMHSYGISPEQLRSSLIHYDDVSGASRIGKRKETTPQEGRTEGGEVAESDNLLVHGVPRFLF